MLSIPCTIQTGTDRGADFWIISIPADAVGNAVERLAELRSGVRKRIVFLDRKTEFVLTAETAAYGGRCVPISKNWLDCLDKLFTGDIRPGISHLDWEFSDQHIDITVTIIP